MYKVNLTDDVDASKVQFLFDGEPSSQFGSLASNYLEKKVYYTDVFNNFIGVYDINVRTDYYYNTVEHQFNHIAGDRAKKVIKSMRD